MKKIGIIGGSGLYEIPEITDLEEIAVETPYGKPSDVIMKGRLEDAELYFLPRHGRGHRFNPSNVPYTANIYALKSLGVRFVFSVSATGSLREAIEPTHLVIPDQLIDKTKGRANTFFDPIAVHVAFADPFCNELRKILVEEARAMGVTVHDGGTYVCMEGPLFSTRAESHLHRSWGASLIGMTALPETKLAREAEIAYAQIAIPTDYDCWHEEDVDIEMVLQNLSRNVSKAKELIARAVRRIPEDADWPSHHALDGALITAKEHITPEMRRKFDLFLGRFL